MIADFINVIHEWCALQIVLWKKPSKAVFKQGDIWWCSLGLNIGEEMYGKGVLFSRPVLVFRKFTTSSFLGLPLTKQEKEGTWYVEITIHGERNWVILNQVRILDKKLFTTRIGALDNADFEKPREQFLKLYSS